jgi:hypothetical protein
MRMRNWANAALAVGAAVAATGGGYWAATVSDGWLGVLVWRRFALILGTLHTLLTVLLVKWAARCTATSRWTTLTIMASGMLLCAFLLQFDVGDGSGWIVLSALPCGSGGLPAPPRPDAAVPLVANAAWSRIVCRVPLPGWWPGWVNLVAFAPWIVTWGLLARETRRVAGSRAQRGVR